MELGLGKSGWSWDWVKRGGDGTGYTCGDGKQKCKQELLPTCGANAVQPTARADGRARASRAD